MYRRAAYLHAVFKRLFVNSESVESLTAEARDKCRVNVDYLIGATDERTNFNNNEDVKVALFGGDVEVTPEMWEEVQEYVEYIKHKYKDNNNNNNEKQS